jgi:hypothetical protein
MISLGDGCLTELRTRRTKRCTPSCGGLPSTFYSVARRNRVIAVVRLLSPFQ